MVAEPVDACERASALNIARSFCVVAPAGSGKTELLTQRLLKLLAVVETPEAILAITFTRKAAAEMRERVMQALQLGLQPQPPEQVYRRQTWALAQAALSQDAVHGWRLLDNPARLKMQTIDSLCHTIAREQPLLSLLGGNLQPVDDAEPLYEAAVVAFLLELESDGGASEQLASLLLHYDNDIARLSRLFVDMLGVREQWLGHVVGYAGATPEANYLDNTLTRWIEHALQDAERHLQKYAADIAQAGDFAASVLHDNPDCEPASAIRSLRGITGLPAATVDHHSQWLGVVELLLTASFTPRKALNKKQGFLPKNADDKVLARRSAVEKPKLLAICQAIAQEPEVVRALSTVARLPLGGYGPAERSLLEPLSQCLVRLCGHLHVVFGQSGQCDHGEIASAALRALGYDNTAGLWSAGGQALQRAAENLQNNASAYAWNCKLQHILVDEFQDTSISQFYLLHALTAQWPQYNALNPQRPCSLFIVGDGMQSIYSFRQARVELFLRARRDGLGELALEPLELSQNFRSSEAIVSWNNRRFSRAFPACEDLARGAVCYSASAAYAVEPQTDNQPDSPAVVAYACVEDDDGTLEAAQIVAEIEACLQRDDKQSIAILVRARSHLVAIIPALNAAGIGWQGTDLDPLNRREVVIDCMTLARATLNPADELAWYAMLRAPWCGLELSALQILKDHCTSIAPAARLSALVLDIGAKACTPAVMQREDIDGLLAQLGEVTSNRLKLFARSLWQCWSQRSRATLRDWLEHCWHSIGGHLASAHGADGDDTRSAQAFFDTLECLEQECQVGQASFSLDELERRVARLYAAPPARSDATAVQIMTIHKSKGLEFDTVILPGLARGGRAGDKPLLMSSERVFANGVRGTLLYPRPPTKLLARDNKKTDSDIYEFLRSEAKLVQQFELTRLLYVATTRARSRLVLSADLNLAHLDEAEAGACAAERYKPPTRGSMLEKLWPEIAEELIVIEPPVIESGEAVEGVQTAVGETPPRYALLKRFDERHFKLVHQHPMQAHAPATGLESEPEVNGIAHSSGTSSGATIAASAASCNRAERAAGTCVHEILHWVGAQGLPAWRDRDFGALQQSWLLRLQQLGVESHAQEVQLDKVKRAVEAALRGAHAAWLFSESHSHRANEWSLMHEREASSVTSADSATGPAGYRQWARSVIDTTFIDRDNNRWIIDYKVAEPERGTGVEAFLERERAAYSGQLAHYRRLLGTLDRQQGRAVNEIRCALYFPLLDTLLEIEDVANDQSQ